MLRYGSRIWLVVFGVVLIGALWSGVGDWVEVVRGQDSTVGSGNENDGAEVLLGKIAEVRKEVFLAEAGSEGRGKLIEKLLLLRRKLVKDFSDDIRVSSWEGDLAFDLLFVAGTEGGLDLEVEFGVVSEAMREKYHGYAVEAHELADDAIAGAGDRVLDIEDTEGFNDDVKLQQERRRLVQMEVRRRLPFLSAAAAYGVAVSGGMDKKERNYYQEVIDSGDDLDLMLDEPWRSRMRVMRALALIWRGDVAGGNAILDKLRLTKGMDEVLRFRVAMGRVMIRDRAWLDKWVGDHWERKGGENGGGLRDDFDGGDPQWIWGQAFYALLRCNHEFRFRLGLGEGAGRFTEEGARWEWLLSSYQPFIEDTKLSIARSARERAVGERVSRVIGDGVSVDEMPAIVVLARAEGMLGDEGKRAEAIGWLRGLVKREGVAEWVEARGRYLLATGLLLDGKREEAARLFLDIAESFRKSDDAENAITQALGISYDLWRKGGEASGDTSGGFEKASLFAMKSFGGMSHFDEWMYRRGEFELARGEWDGAVEAFGLVGEESPLYGSALVEMARARYMQGIGVIENGGTGGKAGSVEARKYFSEAILMGMKAREVIAMLRKGERGKGLGDAAAVLAVVMADSQLRTGKAEAALEVIDEYQKEMGMNSLRESPQFAELLRLRVEGLTQLGKAEEADGEVRTLAREAPGLALPVLQRMVVSIHDELHRVELAGGKRVEIEKRAKERLLPLAKMANDLARKAVSGDSGNGEENMTVRYQYGEALRLAGDYDEAKKVLGGVLAERGDSAEVVFAYGECCYQTGDDEEAMGAFRKVSRAFAGERNDLFWMSEARMLEILDRTGHQTERIFPRIQRLRKYDEALGGGRSKRILEGLEKKHWP